jgi:hypothetical protein
MRFLHDPKPHKVRPEAIPRDAFMAAQYDGFIAALALFQT